MVLPEPYFSLSDSRDTSCAIRFFSEPVPQLRDSWDNTWCYRKPRRDINLIRSLSLFYYNIAFEMKFEFGKFEINFKQIIVSITTSYFTGQIFFKTHSDVIITAWQNSNTLVSLVTCVRPYTLISRLVTSRLNRSTKWFQLIVGGGKGVTTKVKSWNPTDT